MPPAEGEGEVSGVGVAEGGLGVVERFLSAGGLATTGLTGLEGGGAGGAEAVGLSETRETEEMFEEGGEFFLSLDGGSLASSSSSSVYLIALFTGMAFLENFNVDWVLGVEASGGPLEVGGSWGVKSWCHSLIPLGGVALEGVVFEDIFLVGVR